ncbi:MAG TPA: aldose epimerase family protein [Verrucomicrobiae bacterium]|jgi:aldose 1-epimerase
MAASNPSILRTNFGLTPDGLQAELFTLRNRQGLEARITNYGGLVTSLKTPDRDGRFADVVLGFDRLEEYLKGHPYFGALIGRYGNRIAHGTFSLNGRTHQLAVNNGANALHGGLKGFDKVLWQVTACEVVADEPTLTLAYLSADGEEGYPGNLSVQAVYTLTEDNALALKFTAKTDQPTVCNLTHHSYFNLAGQGNVLHHVVRLNAEKFTPVDSGMIPTGELRPVAGTPFDFRAPTPIGLRINKDDEQLKLGRGYDHNFVLEKMAEQPAELSLAATVYEPLTGRTLEVWTTEPGVQFYTGNFLDGTLTGKGGWKYQSRDGFCFEPQHFPDSPNQPAFPTTELKPGQTYTHGMRYKFGVE